MTGMGRLEVSGAGRSVSAALKHIQANHSRPYTCWAGHGTCHGNDMPLPCHGSPWSHTIDYHDMATEDRGNGMGNHAIVTHVHGIATDGHDSAEEDHGVATV